MHGIYIHIPFCRRACTYCNFHFTTSLRQRTELSEALCTELKLRSEMNPLPEGEQVSSVYFGGGTPSLLQDQELGMILQTVFREYPVSADAEITLEANPDDIGAAQLSAWKGMGINRLSVGLQSFVDTELKWMNRTHDAHASEACLYLIEESEFEQYSVDLIYGSPRLSDQDWVAHLEKVTAFGVPHLSCYALTLEPGTLFQRQVQKGTHPAPLQERQAAQFLLLMDFMRGKGYRHYEISNFCLPGNHARHNSAYWQNAAYTGFGPSAHSYDGRIRRWNLSNNSNYIRALTQGFLPPSEQEVLTRVQQINEYIMLSLRTDTGVAMQRIDAMLDENQRKTLLSSMARWMEAGRITGDEAEYRLTDSGKLFADGIAADLFLGD